MSPELETWVTRFAAGAGSVYRWQLEPVLEDGVLTYNLRALLADDRSSMCPLTAEETYESGTVLCEAEYVAAAQRQGVSSHVRRAIVAAADNVEYPVPPDAMLCARLLGICRVEEPLR